MSDTIFGGKVRGRESEILKNSSADIHQSLWRSAERNSVKKKKKLD